MATLKWDEVGTRAFEGGIDRGVLYLSDGSAIPWSGLTSVSEKIKKTSDPVYYEGSKIYDIWTLGDFQASVKAITYPDELMDLEGLEIINFGVFVADQEPKRFSMSYRTGVGDDLGGEGISHKIHILFDLVANPSDKTYNSISVEPSLTEFEWEITSVPPEVLGFRPTGHIIVDTAKAPYWLKDGIERILYGDEFTDPGFLTPGEFITFLLSAVLISIRDNADGTFTIETLDDDLLTNMGGGLWKLDSATITVIDSETYLLTDTITNE